MYRSLDVHFPAKFIGEIELVFRSGGVNFQAKFSGEAVGRGEGTQEGEVKAWRRMGGYGIEGGGDAEEEGTREV